MDFFNQIISLISIVIMYLGSFYCIYNKKYTHFAIVYLFSIFFYDYTFINAYYFLPSYVLNLLKPYSEYLFIVLFARYIISLVQNKNKKDKVIDRMMMFILVPSLIVLISNDLTTNINIGDTIFGLRLYLLPILIPYLMYKANWLNNINEKKLLSALFSISIITVIFGFFQRQSFNGNVRTLWFYNFFNQYKENLVELGPYNFIRNDILRTTSFFVSPIIYSIALAIPTIYVLGLLISKNKLFSKWYLLITLFVLIYGLLIAETRVGLIVVAMGGAILMIPKFVRLKYAYLIMLLVPLLAMIVTFGTLIYGYTDDLSALGRLTQYMSFFDYFKPQGLGFNSEFVLTKFDTYYMSVGLVFGVFVVSFGYFYLKLNRVIYNITLTSESNSIVFNKSTLALSLTFIYSFAFQFTAGAYPYRILFFLVFIILAKYIKNGKEL